MLRNDLRKVEFLEIEPFDHLTVCCFSLSSEHERLSFHILSLSPDDYLKSVVANKLLC